MNLGGRALFSSAGKVCAMSAPGEIAVDFGQPVSSLATWGDDMLGTERIQPGARYTARVERDDQCNYDFRIVYQGGREERRMRQNICARQPSAAR